VHRPVSDTWVLAEAIAAAEPRGRSVADLCCGSGALAIAASLAGARSVLAVDISLRAVVATRVNAALNHCAVRVRRGDLIDALGTQRFDLIACNPPYVPSETDELPRHGANVALDGGRSGRMVIDRVCRAASEHLEPGGALFLVHSSVCGSERSMAVLSEAGLTPTEVLRVPGELGPVMRSRAPMLRARGVLGGSDLEDLVVLRGQRDAAVAA
jgi:release factor glutamine methyltransferase